MSPCNILVYLLQTDCNTAQVQITVHIILFVLLREEHDTRMCRRNSIQSTTAITAKVAEGPLDSFVNDMRHFGCLLPPPLVLISKLSSRISRWECKNGLFECVQIVAFDCSSSFREGAFLRSFTRLDLMHRTGRLSFRYV